MWFFFQHWKNNSSAVLERARNAPVLEMLQELSGNGWTRGFDAPQPMFTILGSIPLPSISRLPTEMGSLNRRGPALPGLK